MAGDVEWHPWVVWSVTPRFATWIIVFTLLRGGKSRSTSNLTMADLYRSNRYKFTYLMIVVKNGEWYLLSVASCQTCHCLQAGKGHMHVFAHIQQLLFRSPLLRAAKFCQQQQIYTFHFLADTKICNLSGDNLNPFCKKAKHGPQVLDKNKGTFVASQDGV